MIGTKKIKVGQLDKTTLDTLYQAPLVSGTNIKTINGTSVLGSGDLVVSGGSTAPILTCHWASFNMSVINTWRGWGNTTSILANPATSYGTGTLPTTTGTLYADTPVFPINGVTQVNRITLNIRNLGGTNTFQAYIIVADFSTSRGYETNMQVLVNQTFTAVNDSLFVDFTINSHTTLNDKSIIHVFLRQTNGTVLYNLATSSFNIY